MNKSDSSAFLVLLDPFGGASFMKALMFSFDPYPQSVLKMQGNYTNSFLEQRAGNRMINILIYIVCGFCCSGKSREITI